MKLFTGICSLLGAALCFLMPTAEPETALAQEKDPHASIPSLDEMAGEWTPAILKPDRFVPWAHLCSALDGLNGSICLYLNGKRVIEHRRSLGVKLCRGEADIGNWTPAASWGGRAV